MNQLDPVGQRHENLMLELQDNLSAIEVCKEAHAPFYLGVTVGVVWAMREAGISNGVITFLVRDAFHQIEARWPGLQQQYGSPLKVTIVEPAQGVTA